MSTATYQIYDIANLARFEAQDCIKGIFINPKMPAGFENTAHEDRPLEQMIWWGRPFIVGDDEHGWDLRCLDGGAWDRSTWLSSHETIDEAVSAAHEALIHPKYISAVKPLGGGAFGMSPVEW